MEHKVHTKTMLFVEDDPGWRLIIKYMVKNMDIDAIFAPNAEDALTIIQSRNDLVCMFLDMSLGNGMSGHDLAIEIKSRKCYEDIPMIAMTAHTEQFMSGYKEEGFTGFLQKPYSLDQFDKVLEAYA